jgi:hypothetical protein
VGLSVLPDSDGFLLDLLFDPEERRLLSKLHGVTTQKIVLSKILFFDL